MFLQSHKTEAHLLNRSLRLPFHFISSIHHSMFSSFSGPLTLSPFLFLSLFTSLFSFLSIFVRLRVLWNWIVFFFRTRFYGYCIHAGVFIWLKDKIFSVFSFWGWVLDLGSLMWEMHLDSECESLILFNSGLPKTALKV